MPPPQPLPEEYLIAEHNLRGYELGTEGNLKFVNILHYLQEASEMHADRIGVGIDALSDKNLLWVLARYHICLHRYPRRTNKLRVFSWPFGFERLMAIRDFVFADPTGTPYGVASSAWLVVTSDGFRPVRPEKHLPNIPAFPHRAIDNDFRQLPKLSRTDHSATFRVRMHDLDVNRHVNNAVYVEWALEATPASIWHSYRPYEVEAQFSAMAFYGDSVQVDVCVISDAPEPRFLHRICRADDGTELTRLRTRWAPL